MKCEFFENEHKYDLEKEINKLIKDKKGVHISLTTTKYGYSTYYTAIVYWEE